MLAPPELLKIHPLGKSPVLTDGEKVIAESGAIIEYLLDHYDAKNTLRPAPHSQSRLKLNYWLHYAEGSLMPPLLLHLIFNRLSKSPMPLLLRPAGALIGGGFLKMFVGPQLRRHLEFIESELSSGFFVDGRLSAADIIMSFPMEAAKSRVGFEKYPRAQKFLDTIHARPAYQRAIMKGGPFTF